MTQPVRPYRNTPASVISLTVFGVLMLALASIVAGVGGNTGGLPIVLGVAGGLSLVIGVGIYLRSLMKR